MIESNWEELTIIWSQKYSPCSVAKLAARHLVGQRGLPKEPKSVAEFKVVGFGWKDPVLNLSRIGCFMAVQAAPCDGPIFRETFPRVQPILYILIREVYEGFAVVSCVRVARDRGQRSTVTSTVRRSTSECSTTPALSQTVTVIEMNVLCVTGLLGEIERSRRLRSVCSGYLTDKPTQPHDPDVDAQIDCAFISS